MIPRFSLYGDPSVWNGNVQEDVEGRWLRWKDAESYVQYALANGYVPPVVEVAAPQPRQEMVNGAAQIDHVLDGQVEMFGDEAEDVYDLIMGQAKDRFDGEEV